MRFRYGLIFPGYRVERWYWEDVAALRKSAVAAIGIFGNGLESAVKPTGTRPSAIQTVEDSFAADDQLQQLESRGDSECDRSPYGQHYFHRALP